MALHALILAGGSGTRFWPQSRRSRPKQLLRLFSERSLVAETRERLRGLVPAERTWVVAPRALAPALRRELADLPASAFILEPAARNTAPAIALAATALRRRDPDPTATLAILPADHVVRPAEDFRRAIEAAERIAATPGRIVLFGIRPRFAATGYGYIRRGAPLEGADGRLATRVAEFIEKPDPARARTLATDPACLWNGGIVVATVATILDAFERAAPGFREPIAAAAAAAAEGGAPDGAAIEAAYLRMPEGPFDKAVLERWSDIAVIEAPFEWDDVGDFRAVERHVPPVDADGNVARGAALFLHGAKHCTVVAPEGSPFVVASGVEDVFIVCTNDAVLVCRKGDGERIRAVVEAVRKAGRADLLE